MDLFINFLRAFGTIIITNSHYTEIYPISIIASGGLLGDVIFFAVSGYCISDIKDSFVIWYKKRILKIYIPTIIITILYLVMGFYNLENMNLLEYFIYPTYYHFIASLMIIYIPLYFIVKYKILRENIFKITSGICLIQGIIYITLYDSSYYHIDNVREPMIRFLFLYSMLLGVYFKENKEKFINANLFSNKIITIIMSVVYFFSKLFFLKMKNYSSYQILNQIILMILLYYILKLSSGLERDLKKLSKNIVKLINYLSKITLEIYLVQYVVISKLSHYVFPLNWLITSCTILILAILLKGVSRVFTNFIKRG